MEEQLNTRVNNAILLAQAMELDITEPMDAQKVLRHLLTVESYVRDANG